MVTLFPAAILLAAFLIFRMYPVSEEAHDKILSGLTDFGQGKPAVDPFTGHAVVRETLLASRASTDVVRRVASKFAQHVSPSNGMQWGLWAVRPRQKRTRMQRKTSRRTCCTSLQSMARVGAVSLQTRQLTWRVCAATSVCLPAVGRRVWSSRWHRRCCCGEWTQCSQCGPPSYSCCSTWWYGVRAVCALR